MTALLDTSVIVRYLRGDVPALAKRAAEIIEHEEGLVVHEVALAEAAFVLDRLYGLPREVVADALIALVQRENIRAAEGDKGVLVQALLLCKPSGRVSFADALIWAVARRGPHSVVYSFDERFPSEGVEVRR